MSSQRPTSLRHRLSRRALAALAGAATLATRPRSGLVAQTPEPAGEIDLAASIGPLLAATPAQALSDEMLIPFYYADLAGQLASVGVERPAPDDQSRELPEGFFEGSLSLPLAARAYETGLAEEWFLTFGFNPYAAGQTLLVSEPPNVISMFAGGFDRSIVEAALEASGYQVVLQETGGPYYSFGDGFSPDTTVGRLGLGAMNQAMVTDDLLVFARDEGDLQAVTHTVAGSEPSTLEQGIWGDLVSLFPPDVVALVPLAPAMLAGDPDAPAVAASPVAGEALGEVQYLAFGVRAGARSQPIALVGEGTPEATPAGEAGIPARVEARIRYTNTDLAAREAAAIPERWETSVSAYTMQPFPELMTLEAARVAEQDAQVVALEFVTEVPNRWVQMIHQRDLAPLAPVVG